jgi:FtsP/CotA-like multicopper oxidase with cupredoxin domain
VATDPNYVDLRAALVPGGVPRMCAAGPNTGVFTSLRAAAGPGGCVKAVRQVYLNERVDGTTLAPLGMQLNGVPFEYRVTETPRDGTVELWQFVNLTVDAHPMHPHLVKHQIVGRQAFNVGQYKALLCGSTTCQPGTAPGGEMQAVPNVTPLLTGALAPVTNLSVEGGWKDATQAPPGKVTSIIAWWGVNWNTTGGVTAPPACAPGGCAHASTWSFESPTAGPYVWHCHINSHEDSEMMRTSLVVP